MKSHQNDEGTAASRAGTTGAAAIGALAVGAAMAVAAPVAVAADKHVVLPAEAVEWGPGPASIPAGAEAVVLYGDPGAEELFALRLKLPDGYHIAPHTHPRPEIVTVISGTLHLGMGEEADPEATQRLEAGSFFGFEPGMAHYVYAEGETVIQLNSTGPWTIDYVDADDDPRM